MVVEEREDVEDKEAKKKKKQSQKRYMDSGSLCPVGFIKVKSRVSLVAMGQQPHRGRLLLPSKEE